MTQAVIVDLRDEEFHTQVEMNGCMKRRIEKLHVEFESFLLVQIILHEQQQKWLRFDLVERGELPADEAPKKFITAWESIPVSVVDSWDGVPCPGCGRLHDGTIG